MPSRPAAASLLKRASPPLVVVRCPFLYTARCRSLLASSHEAVAPRTRCDWRGFSTSRCLRSAAIHAKNHYERLHVRHDATPAEIKKSFYRLSKAHHPDINPNDPSASHTFSLLSESYTVLSDPPRRATYDRDVLRLHQHASPHAAGAAAGASYHSSTTPAGGRPASGLSRRRGTFRGPPPSFYRSGGWGPQADKRQKAHHETTGAHSHDTGQRPGHDHHHHAHHPNPFAEHQYQHPHQHQHQHGGMGPGADPFGHHDDVPHFDRRATEHTQQREDRRRWARERRAFGDDGVEFEPQMSIGAHFVVVLGILAASFIVPMLYLRIVRSNKRNKEAN